MPSLPTLMFPLCPDLLLEEITCEGRILCLTVRREARMGTCPDCAQDSGKVHSRYTRTLADVSFMDYAVRLRVQVRRFFCSNPACARITFAEAFADLTAPYARRTNRQVSRLRAIAKELGGRPAARESENVQMPVSRHTMLRLLRCTPVPAPPTPRILGVDDWSVRKGRTYATLLIDLQRHRIVDVLPDREAQTLEAWLAAHPGVEVIIRDRAGAYARGARKGAPQAQQVTDRFHLLLNLQETLKRLFERKHELLKHLATWEPAQDEQSSQVHQAHAAGAPERAQPISVGPKLSPAHEAQHQLRRERRKQRYDEVIRLHEQGVSQVDIATLVGLDRNTVRRYIQAPHFPELARPNRHKSKRGSLQAVPA
jgi:transposase